MVMTGAKQVHRVRRQAEGKNDSSVSGAVSAGLFNIILWLTVVLLLTTIAISGEPLLIHVASMGCNSKS